MISDTRINMNTLSRFRWILCIVFVLSVCGCTLLRNPGPPPRYFVLSPIDSPHSLSAHTDKKETRRVIVGPVDIPSYLDRPQIILGYDNNQLIVSEENRWGEPLDHAIERVVAINISRLSKGAFEACPFSQGTSLEVESAPMRVNICILSFEPKKDSEVELDVLWCLAFRGQGSKAFERHKFFSVPLSKATVQSTIDAMNVLLAKMSEDIISELAIVP